MFKTKTPMCENHSTKEAIVRLTRQTEYKEDSYVYLCEKCYAELYLDKRTSKETLKPNKEQIV